MKLIRGMTTAIAGACFAIAGMADTVTFPDGSTMDGDVVEINANCIELSANGQTLQLQRSEIASFEHNDKKPAPGTPLVVPAAAQWEKEMETRTGLKSADRARVCDLLDALVRQTEPADRKRLEQDLVELNKKVDVLAFIKATFDDAGVVQQMQRLEAYLVLQPSAALPYVQKGLTTNFPPMRELAVNGYAKIAKSAGKFDKAAITAFARALLDPDNEVRIAAAHALAESSDKTATPVLIDTLSAAEPRLRNAADAALSRIWGAAPPAEVQDRHTYWSDQWNKNAAAVSSPLTTASLTPLVDPNAPMLIAHH